MAIEKVREYFESFGAAARIREFDVSSATVELAAQALGCAPERIAKTLSFLVDGGCALVVAAGDAKVDNPRFKAQFHTKAKMLTPGEVEAMVGHAVGGVCPFAVNPGVKIYLDASLRRFETVFPFRCMGGCLQGMAGGRGRLKGLFRRKSVCPQGRWKAGGSHGRSG